MQHESQKYYANGVRHKKACCLPPPVKFFIKMSLLFCDRNHMRCGTGYVREVFQVMEMFLIEIVSMDVHIWQSLSNC